MALSDFFGGQQVFDPTMALAMIRSPELVVQHLAAAGHEPPDDFDEKGIAPQDAHESLGRVLAYNGSDMERPGFVNPNNPLTGWMAGHGAPQQAGAPRAPTPPPWQGPDQTMETTGPAATARELNAATAGEEAPADSTGSYVDQGPSNIPEPDQSKATAKAETVVDTMGKQKKDDSDPLDSFTRSLMGLKAPQRPEPVRVSTPQAPRATNMIARSTIPQTLMQEMSALAHPSAAFRLGEALRGKAYA